MDYKKSTWMHLFKYWIPNIEKTQLLIIVYMVIFLVYIQLFGKTVSLEQLLSGIPDKLLIFSFIMLFTYSIASVKSSIPLIIAFGETRKRALMEYYISVGILLIQIFIFYILALLFFKESIILENPPAVIAYIVSGILMSLGVSQLLAVCSSKVGQKKAVLIMSGLIMFMCMLISMLFFYINKIIQILVQGESFISAIVLFISIALYTIGTITNYRYTKNMTISSI